MAGLNERIHSTIGSAVGQSDVNLSNTHPCRAWMQCDRVDIKVATRVPSVLSASGGWNFKRGDSSIVFFRFYEYLSIVVLHDALA